MHEIGVAIEQVATSALESIDYQMATFTIGKHRMHAGAFMNHLGFSRPFVS